jgi:hypothetical protein
VAPPFHDQKGACSSVSVGQKMVAIGTPYSAQLAVRADRCDHLEGYVTPNHATERDQRIKSLVAASLASANQFP